MRSRSGRRLDPLSVCELHDADEMDEPSPYPATRDRGGRECSVWHASRGTRERGGPQCARRAGRLDRCLHEADRMYLQVKRDNIPALRLYERMSFSEMFGYHYHTAG